MRRFCAVLVLPLLSACSSGMPYNERVRTETGGTIAGNFGREGDVVAVEATHTINMFTALDGREIAARGTRLRAFGRERAQRLCNGRYEVLSETLTGVTSHVSATNTMIFAQYQCAAGARPT